MKRKSFWLAIITVGILTLVGCNEYLAASQPLKVDLDAFSQGVMTRDVIVPKLGTPASSVNHENGTRTGVYEFYKSTATGWKIGCLALSSTEDEMIRKKPAVKDGMGDMEFGTNIGSTSRNDCFE